VPGAVVLGLGTVWEGRRLGERVSGGGVEDASRGDGGGPAGRGGSEWGLRSEGRAGAGEVVRAAAYAEGADGARAAVWPGRGRLNAVGAVGTTAKVAKDAEDVVGPTGKKAQ